MQGPNMLNQEMARSKIGEGVRRAELARSVGAASAARRSKGQSRNPWAVVASVFRREGGTASAPATATRRQPTVIGTA